MKILVTAGPTREYLDTVRFISNGSSGRMGYAIAAAAAARGHEVVLVSGPVQIVPPPVTVVQVTTAAEMLRAALAAFEDCDVAVMTAAVSDYRPVVRLDHKAPKSTGVQQIALEPTEDICATLGAGKGDRLVIGFAVQDESPHERAEQKMRRKHCDAMVLNGPQTLGSADIRLEMKAGDEPWGPVIEVGKAEAGDLVVDLIERLAGRRRAR